MLRQQFGLTKAEAEVLINFVDGESTQEIAKKRERSHETIRAQFQSIRSKIGARNQTELLRATLSVSGFVKDIGEIAHAVEHPHRRNAIILRKGGRRVELTMMGDFDGDPALMIANAQNYTFNAEVEKELNNAGICLISVCTPGSGHTDPAPTWPERSEYLFQDVEAVLDQLEIKKCLMFAYNSSCTNAYMVTNNLQGRFYHLAHVAAPPPLKFMRSIMSQSTHLNGILQAGLTHPALKKLLFRTALKAWVTMGTKSYLKMQFSSRKLESKTIFSGENLREYENALAVNTLGGVKAAAEDLGGSLDDWTSEVRKLLVDITVIHGKQDSLFTIDNTRNYANHFPEKIEMIEIENAGFPLLQSHTKTVVRNIREMIDANCPTAIENRRTAV